MESSASPPLFVRMIAWGHLKRAVLLLTTTLLANASAVLLYRVSSCKDFVNVPTPLVDDTHIQVLDNINCEKVSVCLRF